MSNLVVAAVADTTVDTRRSRLPKHGLLATSALATTPETTRTAEDAMTSA